MREVGKSKKASRLGSKLISASRAMSCVKLYVNLPPKPGSDTVGGSVEDKKELFDVGS